MDKISKALNKLLPKERARIRLILLKIRSGAVVDLDVKKLKGMDGIFRVRVGEWRIIYRVGDNGSVNIIALEKRSDNTYNF